VTVIPGRLKRVAADKTEAAKFKAVRAVADVGALNLAHHIGFAATRRAGAGAPELFQGDVAFLAVAPSQRKFLADDFGAERMKRGRIGHEEKLATVTDRRYIINS
jgi:hypothetical protein